MNKQKPLISVIVPIYNTEKYLERCIDSILNQTYERLEIILVNDGSPDRCIEICRYYEKKDKRVKIITKKNGGLSDARNSGIEYSTGEYIAFVDSDDWIRYDMYEELYNLIINNKADLAICDYEKMRNSDMQNNSYIIKETSKIYCYDNRECLKMFFTNSALRVQMIVAWNKLYKRSMFENIRFPYGMLCEDGGTIYKIITMCKKIVYTEKRMYYYFDNDSGITHGNMKRLLRDTLKLNEETLLFFQDMRFADIYYYVLHRHQEQLIQYYYMLNDKEQDDKTNVRKQFHKAYILSKRSLVKRRLKTKLRMMIFNLSPFLYRGIIRKGGYVETICREN